MVRGAKGGRGRGSNIQVIKNVGRRYKLTKCMRVPVSFFLCFLSSPSFFIYFFRPFFTFSILLGGREIRLLRKSRTRLEEDSFELYSADDYSATRPGYGMEYEIVMSSFIYEL